MFCPRRRVLCWGGGGGTWSMQGSISCYPENDTCSGWIICSALRGYLKLHGSVQVINESTPVLLIPSAVHCNASPENLEGAGMQLGYHGGNACSPHVTSRVLWGGTNSVQGSIYYLKLLGKRHLFRSHYPGIQSAGIQLYKVY